MPNELVPTDEDTFSGGGVVLKVNGLEVKTLTAISWDYNPSKAQPIVGLLSETYSEESVLRAFPQNTNTVMMLQNEAGAFYKVAFTNLCINSRKSVVEKDDMVLENHYSFTATSMKEGKPGEVV